MKIDLLTSPIAQHYEEHLPSDSAEFKECERLAQDTLARIDKIKMNAAMKGFWLKLSARDYIDASAELFKTKDSPRNPESLPKLKFEEAKRINKDTRIIKLGV